MICGFTALWYLTINSVFLARNSFMPRRRDKASYPVFAIWLTAPPKYSTNPYINSRQVQATHSPNGTVAYRLLVFRIGTRIDSDIISGHLPGILQGVDGTIAQRGTTILERMYRCGPDAQVC